MPWFLLLFINHLNALRKIPSSGQAMATVAQSLAKKYFGLLTGNSATLPAQNLMFQEKCFT
jgi:hypothetical protein